MKRKYNLDKEFLYKEHWDNKKPIAMIAKELNIPKPTLDWYFRVYFKIPTRSVKDTNNLLFTKDISKKILEDKYLVQKKTMQQIADEFKVCRSCIYNKLKKYGIPTRPAGHNTPWNKGLTAKEDKRVRYSTSKCRESNLGRTPWNKGLSNYLSEETLEKMRTAGKNRFKNPEDTYWFGKKQPFSMRSKQSLSHGGTGIPYENSGYTAEFNESLKEKIREKYNYVCQLCGKHQKDNGRKLDVHHVDYDKKNCNESNLVALCHNCHRDTNHFRNYYQQFFEMRYGFGIIT